jgi:hypothetical protein
MEIIQYGIGEGYLKDWGIKEALREIYQNFIDYGNYDTFVKDIRNNRVQVLLSNSYNPNGLEFLQIGKSIKDENKVNIGKHGEGLKMAFLIFLRENLHIQIKYGKTRITPMWCNQVIGNTLALKKQETKGTFPRFSIEFTLDKELYDNIISDIIEEKDIIYLDNYHGSIVDKPIGNLYSGNLFVCNLPNLKKAYNLNPARLSLDRDRRVPGAFDVSYHTSKINEGVIKADAKINWIDQNYDDHAHIEYVPPSQYKEIKTRAIAGKVEFVAQVVNPDTQEKEEVLITNTSIKNHLGRLNFFQKAISGVKNFLADKLGVKDLLRNFRNKHCYSVEAKTDFDLIIQRLGITLDE